MTAPTLTEQQYYLLGMLSKGVIGYGEGGGETMFKELKWEKKDTFAKIEMIKTLEYEPII